MASGWMNKISVSVSVSECGVLYVCCLFVLVHVLFLHALAFLVELL